NGAPVDDVVTLSTTVPSTATSGNIVYDYTTPIVRPLRVSLSNRANYSGWSVSAPSPITTPLTPFARLDYEAMTNKDTPGTVTQYLYYPSLQLQKGAVSGLGPGTFNVWPAPQSPIQDVIQFTFDAPMQDIANAAQIVGFPQEWLQAI